MAAPNILNVSSIVGMTTSLNLSTDTATTFLSNADSSNKVFRINSITGVNYSGVSVDLTLKLHQSAAGAGTSVPIISTVVIPTSASVIVVGKDNPIYLEENRSLSAQASATDSIAIVCSYEEVS